MTSREPDIFPPPGQAAHLPGHAGGEDNLLPADPVLRLMRSQGFGDLQVIKDSGSIPRVVLGTLYQEI